MTSDVTTTEKLAIEAALNGLLVIPALAFLNIPVVKQLFLHFSQMLIVAVYGTMKLFRFELKIDDKVDEDNADFKKSMTDLGNKIDQGASSEEIAIARKNFVDNARKLARAGRDSVQS